MNIDVLSMLLMVYTQARLAAARTQSSWRRVNQHAEGGPEAAGGTAVWDRSTGLVVKLHHQWSKPLCRHAVRPVCGFSAVGAEFDNMLLLLSAPWKEAPHLFTAAESASIRFLLQVLSGFMQILLIDDTSADS